LNDVFIFHELRMHTMKYAFVFNHLKQNQIDVHGYDIPFHGINKGFPRGQLSERD